MKKLVSLFLVVILIMTTVVAFADDYSSMTDEQLKEQLSAIRNELAIRGLKAMLGLKLTIFIFLL